MQSPWGSVQWQQNKAPGIMSVSTAGHGGYRLSSDRMKEIEKRFPTFVPFAGACWLEEDCDWAFAAVTWPNLWSEAEVHGAVKSIMKSYEGRHFEELKRNCPEAMKIYEKIEAEKESA